MPVTHPQALVRMNTFPFLQLAGEERNAIYRALLDDITQPTHAFSVWEEEVPSYENLAAYAALLRVSKTVSSELRSIFEEEYLPNMPLYFTDLRTLYQSAGSERAVSFTQGGGRYVLRAPVGQGCSSGVCALQAMVGKSHEVALTNLPDMVWVVMQRLLVSGLPDEKDETFRGWMSAMGITATKSEDGRYDIACTVDMPASPKLATHPKLTVCSRFQVGPGLTERGQTTTMIEGKVADLRKVDGWDEEDHIRLELNMEEWQAAATNESVGSRTCFDCLRKAQFQLIYA